MYSNYEIKTELTHDCNCQKKKDPCINKTDSCKKIDLSLNCGQKCFEITNYFSELVHEWEKEAARYNLGVLELESIKYKTVTGDEGLVLSKVVFTYRKGHEYKVMEFDVAPRGEKGDKGDKGDRGFSAYEIALIVQHYTGTEAEWLLSLKGAPARITRVNVDYISCGQPTGSCEANIDGNNTYTLNLHLNEPTYDLTELINSVILGFRDLFYDKTYINTLEARIAALEQAVAELTGANSVLSNLNLTYES